MIIVKKIGWNIMPILKRSWTPRIIVVMCTKNTPIGQRRLILISCYTNPSMKAESDKQLSLINTTIRERYPDIDIVIGGDLNRNPEAAKKLAKHLT